MGGAFIREVDPRSIMFDPLCPDIGDGRAVFKFVPYPRAWFRQHYPDKEREMEADGLLLTKRLYIPTLLQMVLYQLIILHI